MKKTNDATMMTIVIPMSALTSAPTTPTQALIYDASPEMEEEVILWMTSNKL